MTYNRDKAVEAALHGFKPHANDTTRRNKVNIAGAALLEDLSKLFDDPRLQGIGVGVRFDGAGTRLVRDAGPPTKLQHSGDGILVGDKGELAPLHFDFYREVFVGASPDQPQDGLAALVSYLLKLSR